jgi:hypothetical protein
MTKPSMDELHDQARGLCLRRHSSVAREAGYCTACENSVLELVLERAHLEGSVAGQEDGRAEGLRAGFYASSDEVIMAWNQLHTELSVMMNQIMPGGSPFNTYDPVRMQILQYLSMTFGALAHNLKERAQAANETHPMAAQDPAYAAALAYNGILGTVIIPPGNTNLLSAQNA